MAQLKGYLTLIGNNFDLDYVSKALEMAPDTTRKSDEILQSGRQFGHDEWGIETELEESDDVECILQKLIDRTSGKTSIMRAVADECDAVWNVLILEKVYDELPMIVFSQDTIRYLYEINAELGFDSYLLV